MKHINVIGLVRKGGGIAILLADKYRCKTLDIKFSSPEFESVFIKLELRNDECVALGSIYRPPNTDPKIFNEEYCVIYITNKERMPKCGDWTGP